MPSNKKRLYVGLYPGSCVKNKEKERYHWEFLVGPKNEGEKIVPGMRYEVHDRAGSGFALEEEKIINITRHSTLHVRILIAKIKDEDRLANILRNHPVVQGDECWTCQTWIASALVKIQEDEKTVGTSQLDWATIEACARGYHARKEAEGRYNEPHQLFGPRPTWDLLEDKEIVP